MNLMNPCSRSATRRAALLGLSLLAASWLSPAARADTVAPPAAQAPLWAAAGQEQPALLETLRALVNIESGSSDREGLDQISELIAGRLRELGGEVNFIEAAPADLYRMEDTPPRPGRMVHAVFKGSGQRRILLIAHMDTVYPRGMLAQQPYRVEGNRAYGLGIADDKQGVATVLHTVALLKRLGVTSYGQLTVLINGDEEISSPASRKTLARLGREHDLVLSYEATRVGADKLSLATSGIAMASLKVVGRASHAGGAPESGINALYELSHQLLQLRDLSVPERGLKVNWTVAKAGVVRNMIPPEASAQADVRLLRVSDLQALDSQLQSRIQRHLLPGSEVSVTLENRRPPLEPSDAARRVGAHAQQIYREIGHTLQIDDRPEGGGTDAAFAALETRAPVLERLGLQGFGAHSDKAEYVLLDSIQPRLYLGLRLIGDFAAGRVAGAD